MSAIPFAGVANAGGLVAHRAIYEMKLDETKKTSGISGANGRMVYEFSGNECDGYAVSFRFVTEFQDQNGGSQVTDLRSSTFEDPNEASFQFVNKTYIDRKLVERARGMARDSADGKEINLKEPVVRSLTIAKGALFPTGHLNKIIEAGRNGQHFLAADVFDGSESGDKVYATTAVIGAGRHEAVPLSDDPDASPSAISDAQVWPVSIAYFDPDQADQGEQTPDYRISFLLYENGISRQLQMDYREFSIKGQLSKLELLDEPPCGK